MDNNLFDKLAQRYMAGEKITALAKDAGIPWQRLWGMLNGLPKGGQRPEKPKPRKPAPAQSPTARGRASRGSDFIDRITFESVGEVVVDALADYAQNETNRRKMADDVARHMTGSSRWANYYTKESLLAAIAKPPAHLIDAVETMRKSLMEEVCPPQASRRKVRRNQEFGDELTPEAVLTRSLTPWERMSRENVSARRVTLGVNLSVSARQQPEELLWRGAAAAALCDILTSRGLSVEIVAFWSIRNVSSLSARAVAKYVVKRSEMPLDLGAVSVALAEIAFARLAALFAMARHMPGVLDNCLGNPERSLPEADAKGIDFLADANITTQTAAVAWLTRVAAQQEREVVNV